MTDDFYVSMDQTFYLDRELAKESEAMQPKRVDVIINAPVATARMQTTQRDAYDDLIEDLAVV